MIDINKIKIGDEVRFFTYELKEANIPVKCIETGKIKDYMFDEITNQYYVQIETKTNQIHLASLQNILKLI